MHRICTLNPTSFSLRGIVVVVVCAFGEAAFILHGHWAPVIKKTMTDWGSKRLSLGRS